MLVKATTYRRDNTIKYIIIVEKEERVVYSDDIIRPGDILDIRLTNMTLMYYVTETIDNKLYGKYKYTILEGV